MKLEIKPPITPVNASGVSGGYYLPMSRSSHHHRKGRAIEGRGSRGSPIHRFIACTVNHEGRGAFSNLHGDSGDG